MKKNSWIILQRFIACMLIMQLSQPVYGMEGAILEIGEEGAVKLLPETTEEFGNIMKNVGEDEVFKSTEQIEGLFKESLAKPNLSQASKNELLILQEQMKNDF